MKLLTYIRNKRFDPNSKMNVTYGCSHYLTAEWERMTRDNYFICGAGINVAGILCNGDIYSCFDIERRPELVQGNIKTDNFVDVWEKRFHIYRKDRTLECSMCKECEDKFVCGADSYHTWDFEKQEPKICLKKGILINMVLFKTLVYSPLKVGSKNLGLSKFKMDSREGRCKPQI